jgi:hypothetical protein
VRLQCLAGCWLLRVPPGHRQGGVLRVNQQAVKGASSKQANTVETIDLGDGGGATRGQGPARKKNVGCECALDWAATTSKCSLQSSIAVFWETV